MTPRRGNNFLLRSSQQLPCPSVSLEWLFELTRRLTRALHSPHVLLPELQRNKDTIKCAAQGLEVPEQSQKQLTQALIVHLLKMHFSMLIFGCKKSTE